MPAIATLDVSPARYAWCDLFPLFRTIEVDSLHQPLIFFLCPSPFAVFGGILYWVWRIFILWRKLEDWRAAIVGSQCLWYSVTALSVSTLSLLALDHTLALNKAEIFEHFKGSTILFCLILHYLIILAHQLVMIIKGGTRLLIIDRPWVLLHQRTIIVVKAFRAEANRASKGALTGVL